MKEGNKITRKDFLKISGAGTLAAGKPCNGVSTAGGGAGEVPAG
jgi:hypothetical protein